MITDKSMPILKDFSSQNWHLDSTNLVCFFLNKINEERLRVGDYITKNKVMLSFIHVHVGWFELTAHPDCEDPNASTQAYKTFFIKKFVALPMQS